MSQGEAIDRNENSADMLLMWILVLLATAASAPNPLMVDWSSCMTAYSDPRLRTETVDQLIEGSLAACMRQEQAVRQSYVRQFGTEVGNRTFDRLKVQIRGLMQERLTAVKQQLGN